MMPSEVDSPPISRKLPHMQTVRVDLAERSYDVRVAHGLLERAGEEILTLGRTPRRIAVVSDATVAGHHAETLIESLGKSGFTTTLHTVAAGEASKSMANVEAICREMIRDGHDRHSMVVALGGGVVGDLAGFAAAVFYRGIPYVQIPTTIVSQVDSSVGGKTGVNAPEGKNLMGAFHQPVLVLVDPETLRTLPDREYREGFAEAIKHAAIRDAAMLDELAALDPASRDVPAELLARNIAIKARVVEADETETLDIRALLNFGHTIGHGIEAAVPYGTLLHGEAISLGIRAALDLSVRHGGLPEHDAAKVLRLLEKFGLPLVLHPDITTDLVMEKLTRDKKFDAGHVRFVVLTRAGDAKVARDLTADDLRAAIERLREES
ncbi:MAG: 3-dehydroquinate synthase [Luteolibacter sp.]